MNTVFSLWWDDASRSTHLDARPYETEANVHAEAARRGLTTYKAFPLDISEAPFYFPSLAKG